MVAEHDEINDFAERVEAIQEPIILDIDAELAVMLISQLQLALRHPANCGPSSDLARGFARILQDRLTKLDPELGRYLERGWHSCFDVPRRKELP